MMKIPKDSIWSPGHLIDVPLILWIEATVIVMRLTFAVTVSVDNIHREWVSLNRWHDLNIELIPASWVEVWSIPVGEE